MPSPKTTSRKSSRSITVKRRPGDQPERPSLPVTALSEEWWSSWRHANALGWDYLNAVTGLFRLPFTALTATRFFTPFQLP